MKKTRLSKTRYQTGLQCEKALWLTVHQRDLIPPADESLQHIFDTGHEVGRMAQRLFAGGIEVEADHFHTEEALADTARLIAEGATVLYEPAFEREGVLVRVDVLVRAEDGVWDLYEVKSTGSVKDQHITDGAIQTWVVEGSGITVRSTSIVHINTRYVYPGGDIELSEYFKIADITDRARDYLPEVPGMVSRFADLLRGEVPEVPAGAQCRKPYECAFLAYCRGAQGEAAPCTEGDVEYDAPALTSILAGLGRPLYYLDFETYMSAIPVHPGTRPYQAIPMQYSVHRRDADGTLIDFGYLHRGPDDPRRELAERLIEDLGTEGTVLQYSKYERTTLRNLAEALPDLADPLYAIIDRLVDLERIVAANTKHPAAQGRTSIKYVLPAFCPDLSYADQAIGDGQTASVRYYKAITGRIQPPEAEQVFSDLESYCGLDTLAMVRLHEALCELVRA